MEEYLDKHLRMVKHEQEATAVNKQFAKWTDEQPEKRDYRHTNMKQEFRRGAIDYGKHMRWIDG